MVSIHVKDESFRFGLNAFKVLGGSYAIENYAAKRLDMDIRGLSYDKLVSREIKEKLGEEMPTHIFLQAGVGAMAGAVTGFFADVCRKGNRPIITIVEPDKADCIYQTALANDEKLHFVTGDMDTIMAGLACGEPCTLGWEMLRDYADYFVSMPDYVAAEGMRILGSPLEGDSRIVSGESGAAGLGFAAEILRKDSLKEFRDMLRLDGNSRILCFSTEGDTDRENYRKILWDGWYSGY